MVALVELNRRRVPVWQGQELEAALLNPGSGHGIHDHITSWARRLCNGMIMPGGVVEVDGVQEDDVREEWTEYTETSNRLKWCTAENAAFLIR